MSDLLQKIDAKMSLAGSNKLEILLFSLGLDKRSGRRATFGINVFKVREVMRTPQITPAPDSPESVEGMINLRGLLVPVIDLAKYAHMDLSSPREIMIVTEYAGNTQGFMVKSVDTILRVDWSGMKAPPAMLQSSMGGLVTAVTEYNDELVMLLDVEKVLVESMLFVDDDHFSGIEPISQSGGSAQYTVFFADDSTVARRQIKLTLDALGVNYIAVENGRLAVTALNKIAQQAALEGRPVKDHIQLILTDVEMPGMDGYMLTRAIKSDRRFDGIPVVMHSSLSGASNYSLGQAAGVDEYVAKFEPRRLAETVRRLIMKDPALLTA